ncbi:hypothetical protein KY285_001082 [Solanum tuberosum]|nr:hypothetical protein KY285_001082 [Solanum tuberosum]
MANDIIPVPLSIDTTDEILLANIKPTKGRRRLRTLNRKCASNPVSESSLPTAEPFILGVRVPQTRQKRRQAEVDLASAMATNGCVTVQAGGPRYSSAGRAHYVKLEWPPLPDKSSALSIYRKFSSNPTLTHHHCIEKNETSPPHQLYFDVVHKIILQPKQQRTHAIFLDLTLMELLDTLRRLDSPLQRLKNQLAEKEHELVVMTTAHQLERESWEARVVALQIELAQERTTNIATVRHLTQLLTPQNPTLSP